MQLSDSNKKIFLTLIVAIISIRILTLGLYPLYDSTESRYAEIGRKMYASGDYITPIHRNGKPFWGKPPLSFWLTALSFNIFGVNDFAARFPSMLCMILVLLLTFYFANRVRGPDAGIVSSLILLSTGLFFIVSGGVMTDPALVVGTTLSMLSFYFAMKENNKLFGYLFFVGIGISLLAKGPVGIVLTAMPCGLWVIILSRWKEFFKNLPWFSGILLGLLISVPWYYLAEQKTPGFLEYFLVGEHYKRFVESGWKGDLYGNAHNKPLGTIWIYLLQSTIPWSFLLLRNIFKKSVRENTFKKNLLLDDWFLFLLLWATSTCIFFSVAKNVIQPYVLPALPAFAILMFELLHLGLKELKVKTVITVSLIMPILFSVAIFIPKIEQKQESQFEIVRHFKELAKKDSKLVYIWQRPYSASFYTDNKAMLITYPNEAAQLLKNNPKNYFVFKERQFDRFKDFIEQNLKIVKKYRNYYLMEDKE